MTSLRTYLSGRVTVHHGDSRDVLKGMASASIDSVVCDPPYALVSIVKRFGGKNAAPTKDGDVYARSSAGFMGQAWDTGETAFAAEFWAEVLRVLKPGGHVLAFSGTRTYHRLACAIEDAGLEIRDMVGDFIASDAFLTGFYASLDDAQRRAFIRIIDEAGFGGMAAWTFGSGFPKSHDIARDGEASRAAGRRILLPEFEGHPQSDGWGTALKPALEPIVLARKPLGGNIYVRANIERALRAAGVEGEIEWTRPVSVAGSPSLTDHSGEMTAPEMGGTFAKSVRDSETPRIESATATCTENPGAAGLPITGSAPEPKEGNETANLGCKSSPLTGRLANAAANIGNLSSPSTTSMGEGPPTEKQFTGKSTPNCGDRDSHPDTESFAGIATGLSGSRATVLIKRSTEGFEWPDGFPEVLTVGTTVAANVLEHGTGALNIDGCRVGEGEARRSMTGGLGRKANPVYGQFARQDVEEIETTTGRWPANVIHDGSEEVLATFPDAPGQQRPVTGLERSHRTLNAYGDFGSTRDGAEPRGDSGSAARFFYSSKADSDDRIGSKHPTVKPVDLMRYLCRLITPPGGMVLDPFAGTGTTGEAAWLEGFRATLIEREAQYIADIERRMSLCLAGPEEKARAIIKAKGKIEAPGPLFSEVTI